MRKAAPIKRTRRTPFRRFKKTWPLCRDLWLSASLAVADALPSGSFLATFPRGSSRAGAAGAGHHLKRARCSNGVTFAAL
jgi:uncharacterized protein (DUF2062 family)